MPPLPPLSRCPWCCPISRHSGTDASAGSLRDISDRFAFVSTWVRALPLANFSMNLYVHAYTRIDYEMTAAALPVHNAYTVQAFASCLVGGEGSFLVVGSRTKLLYRHNSRHFVGSGQEPRANGLRNLRNIPIPKEMCAKAIVIINRCTVNRERVLRLSDGQRETSTCLPVPAFCAVFLPSNHHRR